jgi:hypothetical protein
VNQDKNLSSIGKVLKGISGEIYEYSEMDEENL